MKRRAFKAWLSFASVTWVGDVTGKCRSAPVIPVLSSVLSRRRAVGNQDFDLVNIVLFVFLSTASAHAVLLVL